jgi:hypothetical protein
LQGQGTDGKSTFGDLVECGRRKFDEAATWELEDLLMAKVLHRLEFEKVSSHHPESSGRCTPECCKQTHVARTNVFESRLSSAVASAPVPPP